MIMQEDVDDCNIVQKRLEAEGMYFKLHGMLGSNYAIAKKIAPYYQASAFSIRRNLDTFAFRNKTSTDRFIKSAKRVLDELDNQEISASALLLFHPTTSEIYVKEKANLYAAMGIHAIVPQLLYDTTKGDFWSMVRRDGHYSDFIITHDLQDEQMIHVDAIAIEHDLTVIDAKDAYEGEIKLMAIQISLFKLNPQLKKKKE